MEKQIMEKIKQFCIRECQAAFGFCGVAEGESSVMINTGKEKDIIISIKID